MALMPRVLGPLAAQACSVALFGILLVAGVRHQVVPTGDLKQRCDVVCLLRCSAPWHYSLGQVLNDPTYTALERDLDVVEVWSGVQSVVNAAVKHGLQARPFDINRIPGVTTYSEDITGRTGT